MILVLFWQISILDMAEEQILYQAHYNTQRSVATSET